MNTYFIRYKKFGQLLQDTIKAPTETAAIELAHMYFNVPKEKIKVYAVRDEYGKVTYKN